MNAERTRHGLSLLRVSRLASKLARAHALDMARHGYIGHYDLAGRKPELRFNLLGGTDYVAENIAFLEVGGRTPLTEPLVRSMFADLLASERHRANILHPAHTHMGYAVMLRRSEREDWTRIYVVQEFINDWGDYELLACTVAPGELVTLRGKLQEGAHLAYVAIASEPLPGVRNADEVGEADLHYRQPAPERYFEVGEQIALEPDGAFTVSIPVPQQKAPRDIYVTVWAVAPELPKPFRVMTQVLLLSEEGGKPVRPAPGRFRNR